MGSKTEIEKERRNMTEYYIMVRSVTYAQKISDTLNKCGVKTKTVRRPKNLAVGGCGYAVTVKSGQPALLTEIASSHGFRIYVTDDGKEFRELGYFQKS